MIDEEIQTLIELKKAEKELKDKIKNQTTLIKDYCISNGLRDYKGKYGSCSMTAISNDKLDDEKAATKLQDEYPLTAAKVIKYTVTIDEDALYDCIMNGECPSTVLDDCVIHKEPTYRINTKEVKAKKEKQYE